jgi:hypothetical protein
MILVFFHAVLRVRDVYPGANFFHPGSRQNQKQILSSKNKIRDVHPSSRIPALDFISIPDPDPVPGSRVQKSTSPRIRYMKVSCSVPDPDPNPDPDPLDPRVFEPPGSGSGSISQRYGSGSGSFYH